MKEIKDIIINKTPMRSAAQTRVFTIIGDPGAMFTMTVINEDDHYYNFSEELNKNGQLKIALAFAATPATLPIKTINSSGTYTGSIAFPAITDDDHYVITLQAVGETNLSKNISHNNVLVLPKIYKYKDTTVTFSLSSAGSSGSYNSMPSNVTFVGPSSSSISIENPNINQIKKSIEWDVSLSTSQFIIARQPVETDFQITTTKTTASSSDSTGEDTYIELSDISGLSIRMDVTGSGIASNSIIREIIPGFKNYGKSSELEDVYAIPQVVSTDEQGNISIQNSNAGTIVINNASSWSSGLTLTFTGKGNDATEEFNNTAFAIENLVLTIDPVVTTTDAAVDDSTTIPITSTNGIKAADTVLMTGVGVTAASPHVDAISSGVNITASSAQTLENGQTVTFIGSSRSAKIKADITVLEYGTDDLTITLALDNILTVG
tara:strand:+ start:2263 stop:3567 length:1305 start_codon:yes stop_codon:yes gene_type:complete